jgi:hypothetical protein
MGGLGVAVFNYNRVNYNKLVIESLLRNPEHKTLPFYFFIDGDPSRDSNVAEVAELIGHAQFPFKHMHFRGKQTGCCYNITDGMQQMFEVYNYDKVLLIEDDNLQAANSLRICINLSNYFEQFSNIGFTFSSSVCHLSSEEKKERLNEVCISEELMTNCIFYKKAWFSIRDIMVNYKEKYASSGPTINHCDVIEYLKDITINIKHITEGNTLPVNRGCEWLKVSPNSWCSSQDFVFHISLAVKGYSILATKVNFVKLIGSTGFHFNEQLFKEAGLDRTVLDEFPEFSNVEKFTLVT